MFRLHLIITSLAVAFTGLSIGSVLAADEIIFHWRAASRSLSITDLETYTVTGELSPQLQSYLEHITDPRKLNALRNILNQTVQVDFIAFERYLRSTTGDCMLEQMGTVLNPGPNSTVSKVALRAALVNAAAPDGSLSLLEVMTSYPTNQIHLDFSQITYDHQRAQAIKNGLIEIWQKGGLPHEQLQQLQEQIFTEEYASHQVPLNFIDIDYDLLSDVSLNICES